MPLIVSVIAYIAVTLGFLFFKSSKVPTKKENNKFLCFKSLPLVLSFIGVIVYYLLVIAAGHTVDAVSYVIAAVLLSLCVNVLELCKVSDYFKKKHVLSFLRKSACAIITVVVLEFTVFNISALTSPKVGVEKVLDMSSAVVSQGVSIVNQSAYISTDDASSISFAYVAVDSENISVEFTGSPKMVDLKAYITDDNLSKSATLVCEQSIYADQNKPAVINIHSTNLQSLQLYIEKASGVTISGINVNVTVPVQVNYLRMFGLIILCLLAVAVKAFQLYKIQLAKKSFMQTLAMLIAVIICCAGFLTIFVAKGDTLLESYDSMAVGNKSPYYQMFDAFQKGQLNLDLPVDEQLITAGNKAYDPQYRTENNIYCSWDRAYYNGKYYSYFGTAPLFLIYYPVYFLTNMLPTDSFVCAILGMLITIFGFMLVRKLALTVVKNANFLITLLCAFALPFASSIYILTGYGDFYNVPKLCATAFLLLLVYLTVTAYENPKWYLFLMCGLSVALIAASRPNLVILALATAPIYIAVLLNKDISLKHKLSYVGVFLAPVIICAAALMVYNYQRFDSFFEFGTTYQLTVNNIALNNISLSYLGMAVYHYFLQPASTSTRFPYLSPSFSSMTYPRYFYAMSSFGVFTMPLNWFVGAYPAVRRKTDLKPVYRWFIILSLVLSVGLAFLDFCMAGVTISYVYDITTTISIVAIISLLLCEKCTRKYTYLHKTVYIVSVIFIVLTVLVSVAILFGTLPSIFKDQMPELYVALRNVFSF